MYFDNYLNPKPSSYNFNYSNPSTIQYDPQNIQSTQPPSQNYKAFIHAKFSETNQNFHLQFNKNQSTQAGNYRPFNNQQAGTINPSVIDQKGVQKPINPSFLNSQSSNLTPNQQKKDTLKRRDSNSIGNYFKQNQTHSPSFHANFLQQNKNQTKPNFAQQSHHNVHSMGRPTLSTNNLNNFDMSTLKDPYRSTIIETHMNKDQNMSTSQLKFDQSKHSQKPYALGFRSKNQPLQFEIKKNKTIYEDKQKKFDTQNNKDLSYNFQLRNTTTDWNTFSKPAQQAGQAKFLTPSNIKKQSQNEQANHDIKNYFNKVDNNLKENQNAYRKDINQTERQFSKSPSIDTLLSNAYYRQAQYKKIQKGDLQNNENSFQSNKSKQTQPEQRVGSQGYFVQKTDKKPPVGKNYQALIQNLQKKFSEQKKSSDSFESKQKFYQNEINKKDEKINRLQSIIENNKQTIGSLEQTINHFKKSNELGNNFKLSTELISTIDNLRKQNELLKQELNLQRRKSLSLSHLNNSKDKFDRYQQKIKQLQNALSQSVKEIKIKQSQTDSLRQSYSTLHQSYKNQFKQHQTTRQQLNKIKQNYEQLTKSIEKKTQKIQQLNTQLVYLQSKYQGSLEKLLTQNQHYEKQKTSCQNIIKTLKIQKQTILQSEEKLRNKLKQLQNQLSLKHLQIQTLQEKVNEQQISQEEEQQRTATQKYQFYQNNNDYQQINQQLQKQQQELRLKQQSIEELSLQLKRKTKLIEEISCQKTYLLSKIQNFETKIEMLESQGKSKAQIKSEERSKKTSDSVEIKETIQSSQFNEQKQNLLSYYHEKYSQIVNIFNLLEKNQEIVSSTSQITEQSLNRQKINPSKEYLDKYHNFITDEIKKIFKDLKKLVLALKECQAQSQLKNQRLYQLDKTLKKQVNKIGSLIAQIHMKNSAIADMNKMQLEKQIFRLNEKYQILNQITY